MTTDLHDLAVAVVQSPHWRWMPGMLDTLGWRCFDSRWPHDLGLRVPDLSDPATLGCLLALVREAWGDPTIYARHWNNTGDWCLHRRGGYRLSVVLATEKSEPAALVAALLAAPKEVDNANVR